MLNKTSNTPHASGGFKPLEQISGDNACGLLLLGDHAGKELPGEYNSLGLPESEFSRHIASDIGTRALVKGLAERLGAPAILARFSRLLIDPNRGEEDPTLIMQISDRAIIPENVGPENVGIDDLECEKRLNTYYRPYHDAVSAQLDLMGASGRIPVILSVHSYTHAWRGISRPWHVGILWDKDPRFAVPVIEGLRHSGDLVVGDNEPYKGSLRGDTMYRHGTKRGLAHALIEVRQDLILDDTGVSDWVWRVASIIEGILGRDGLHEIRHYGSCSDPDPDPDLALPNSTRPAPVRPDPTVAA